MFQVSHNRWEDFGNDNFESNLGNDVEIFAEVSLWGEWNARMKIIRKLDCKKRWAVSEDHVNKHQEVLHEMVGLYITLRGIILYHLGRWKEALLHFRIVLGLRTLLPHNAFAVLLAINYLLRTGVKNKQAKFSRTAATMLLEAGEGFIADGKWEGTTWLEWNGEHAFHHLARLDALTKETREIAEKFIDKPKTYDSPQIYRPRKSFEEPVRRHSEIRRSPAPHAPEKSSEDISSKENESNMSQPNVRIVARVPSPDSGHIATPTKMLQSQKSADQNLVTKSPNPAPQKRTPIEESPKLERRKLFSKENQARKSNLQGQSHQKSPQGPLSGEHTYATRQVSSRGPLKAEHNLEKVSYRSASVVRRQSLENTPEQSFQNDKERIGIRGKRSTTPTFWIPRKPFGKGSEESPQAGGGRGRRSSITPTRNNKHYLSTGRTMN